MCIYYKGEINTIKFERDNNDRYILDSQDVSAVLLTNNNTIILSRHLVF